MSANKVLFLGFKTEKQLQGGFTELQNTFGHHQHSPFITLDLHGSRPTYGFETNQSAEKVAR